MSDLETQLRNGQWNELIQTLEEKWQSSAPTPNELFFRALAAIGLQDFAAAYEYAVTSFDSNTESAELSEMLASLCVLVGRHKESYFYRKNLSTLQADQSVAELIPFGIIPDYSDALKNAIETPLLERAKEASSKMNWEQAEHWFLQHIQFNMTDPTGHLELARCQIKQERYRAASETLKGARALFPANAVFADMLGQVLSELGHFDEADASYTWATDMNPKDEKIHANAIKNMVHNPRNSVAHCIEQMKSWYQNHVSQMTSAFSPNEVGDRSKLTVGVFVSGMDRTRIAPFVGDIFSWHDPEKFHLIGYGEGDVTYLFNRYFKAAFVEWRNISEVDSMTLRNMVIADGVDILIDMGGLASIESLKCFGSRCAPIQISWSENQLAAFMPQFDYVVASKTYDELESKKLNFQISNSFYSKRDSLPERPKRADGTFTFIADATLAELTYETISLWAKVLLTNPNCILLLRSHDFFAEDNSRTLIERFGLFGVAQRVDVIQEADRRDFFANGDIALLPAAGASADIVLDALSVGIPLLTCLEFDRHFSSGNQLLEDIGLASFTITKTKEQYFTKANALCINKNLYADTCDAIKAAYAENDTFNSQKRMDAIASTLSTLWETHKKK